MNTIHKSYPSVCIPRILANTTWRDVRNIFEKIIGRGCVERVDMVPKKNHRGEPYYCVFIHLKEWPCNETALQVRERLLLGEDIKLVYDDPWYWKCNVSRVPKPKSNQRIKSNTKHSTIRNDPLVNGYDFVDNGFACEERMRIMSVNA